MSWPELFLCLCLVNQRVFQPGAEASLPGPQQHWRLYIHMERHHDHGEMLIFTAWLSLLWWPQCDDSSCNPRVVCTVRLLWCEWSWGLWGESLQAPQPHKTGTWGLLPEEPRRSWCGAVCEGQRSLQAQQGQRSKRSPCLWNMHEFPLKICFISTNMMHVQIYCCRDSGSSDFNILKKNIKIALFSMNRLEVHKTWHLFKEKFSSTTI